MDAPPLRDGAVAIAGARIAAVGSAADLRRAFPGAAVTDLGDAVLLPGLINPHVHLELSDLAPPPLPAGGFAAWLRGMITRAQADPRDAAAVVPAAVAAGIAQCLRFGVTAVGDITRHPHLSRPVLAASALRAVSYGEVQALGGRRHLLDERVAAAADAAHATPRLTIGLSPHAPYTVEPAGYARCLALARAGGLPIATHLAETRDEIEFVAARTGPFRDLWENVLRAWDDAVPAHPAGPIDLAHALGLLAHAALLAHVNYCSDADLDLLAAGRASVVYCPRTHAYFGHPPHRWRDMLARGVNVAVGTDARASSPDLNLVDDLRLLHRLAPEVPAAELWAMATTRAAAALGLGAERGSLAPGRAADLVAFPAGGDDPLATILEDDRRPAALWIDGVPVALP